VQAQPGVIVIHPFEQGGKDVTERIPVLGVAMQFLGYRRAPEIVPGHLAQRLPRGGGKFKSVPPVQKQRLETRTGFLHSYQPLAVRAEAKARRVARQIGGFAAIQQGGMLMLSVEGPELVQVTFVAHILGILLHPNLTIG
jgi:hypothetical protein